MHWTRTVIDDRPVIRAAYHSDWDQHSEQPLITLRVRPSVWVGRYAGYAGAVHATVTSAVVRQLLVTQGSVSGGGGGVAAQVVRLPVPPQSCPACRASLV